MEASALLVVLLFIDGQTNLENKTMRLFIHTMSEPIKEKLICSIRNS